MPSLGNLTVTLSMDATKLQAGVAKAREGLNTIGAAAAKTTAAVAATAAVSFGALITTSTSAAREITNLSNIAGVATSELSKLGYAASTVGISTEKYADIVKDVNDRVGDFIATGAGPLDDFFKNIAPKVGVTADQFKKLSGPQALQLYVSSLEKAGVSQKEMTFYMEALASDSTALLPLLRDNGAEMARLSQKASDLGIALSDIETEQLNQLGVSIEAGNKSFSAFTQKLGAEFAPIVQSVIDLMEQAAIESGGLGKAASDVFGFIIDASAKVANAVDGIKRVFELAASGIIAFYGNVFASIAEKISGFAGMINKLGLVTIDTTGIDSFGERMRNVASEAYSDVGNILMRPMAGEVFQGFVETARQKSEEAAIAAVDAKNKILSQTGGTDQQGAGALNEDQNAQRLAILRSTLQEERAIIGARYASEIEQINKFYQDKIGLEDEWRQVLIDKSAQFEAEMTAIKKAELKKQQDEEDRIEKERLAHLQDFYNNAASLMQSGSKKMQKIGQAAAIVDAVRHGWGAAIKAWEAGMSTGGPWAPAVAAAYAAASLAKTGAMIQSIKSGGSGGGGGGGGGVPSVGGGAPAAPAQQFNVNVSGYNPNQVGGMGQFGDMMGMINERLRAGETFGGFSY